MVFYGLKQAIALLRLWYGCMFVILKVASLLLGRASSSGATFKVMGKWLSQDHNLKNTVGVHISKDTPRHTTLYLIPFNQ